MRAARQYAPFDVRVEDVPEPTPGPGEIKVRIAYCGICGTDPEIFDGSFGLTKTPQWPDPPFTVGHEACGTIAELGSGLVQGYKVGQRVAMNFRSYCGACYYCRNKMEHMCEHVTSCEGGFQQYSLYRENTIYPLPDEVSFERGALLEPLTVAIHAVDQASIVPGRTLLILGGGTIGQLIMQVAIRAGAAKVLVSDPIREKRQLAERLGADVTVDPLSEDLEVVAREVTRGRGFDAVMEASGRLDAAKQALALAGKCGTVVWAGVYPEQAEISIRPFQLYANELAIRSTIVSPYVFPRGIQLLAKLDLEPLISEIRPLNEIADVLATIRKGTGIKTLINPWS